MKIIVSVTTLLGRTFRVTYTCSARIPRCFQPALIKTWDLFQVSCTIVTILYLAGTTLSLLSTGRLVTTFTSRHLVVKEHGEQAWDEKQTNEN